jgi:hypothetical protein
MPEVAPYAFPGANTLQEEQIPYSVFPVKLSFLFLYYNWPPIL